MAVDGKRVHNVDELLTEVESHAPGETSGSPSSATAGPRTSGYSSGSREHLLVLSPLGH